MIRKGRGVSNVYYPTGFNGGGDPDLVSLEIKIDGTINMTNASCEMGQGFKTVAIQMAAEALEISEELFTIDNSNTDTAAFSMDTAGTRTTYIVGLAAIAAAKDLIQRMKEFVAGVKGCSPEDLVYEGGKVFKKDDEKVAMTLQEIGTASTYGGVYLIGVGGFLPPPAPPRDPETGFTIPTRTYAWGSTVIDVEIDDETGVVTIVNVYNSYDIGTVINPLQAEGQVDGGNVQGVSMALYEDLTPYFPESIETYASNFTDYIIPTFMDIPQNSEIKFYENPDLYGPFGAKGCGEFVTNSQPPAIANAIYDAIGVRINSLPITPEKILRALEEKNK
ncbi:molybdopterin-dependent oxidoreductase [Irregularibacter muris]|uniref:Molybdopterin-dependent oxidoreductase n=1 Tax=Irregularibacter muris TaxID=1796619 RepID=A0AAE3L064_9FIRM|nr:molybdopterin cofactor-binding domain-containing protein [Irregularibacter muris]MCR1899357.1 molybdopterin-dependent oxidoreductase [Irregularibacter muris]